MTRHYLLRQLRNISVASFWSFQWRDRFLRISPWFKGDLKNCVTTKLLNPVNYLLAWFINQFLNCLFRYKEMALPSVLSSDPCSHVNVECIINKECCTVWNFALICCRFSFALPVYLLPSFLSPLCFLPVHQSLTNEYLISALPRTAHFTNLRPGP